jgi:flagellar M-ring protein FliF
MEQLKQRISGMAAALPPGQRVSAMAAIVVVAVVGMMFFRWVSTPSYTLLFGNLDDKALSEVIGELDAQGVPYKIEAGGSQVLVPRAQVYEARASMAEAGVGANQSGPAGYEILEGQGFAVSDFRQRVDYQRALEGELSKTLMAMNGVEAATVRLAIPEEQVFEDEQQPVTASVLLTTNTQLPPEQVESVVFLVSSAVEGLDPKSITVADSNGTVLSAPGDDAIAGVGDRTLRQTRSFEQALAGDVARLLSGVGGSPHVPSVVVRAELNFDETETETETFDPDSQVTLREDVSTETLGGDGAAGAAGAQGVVGVDGGVTGAAGGAGVEYEKSDTSTDYGVNREITRTTVAPGAIEKLSVAIVMDDGSATESEMPTESAVEDLVTAALGLDEERGDTIEVEAVPFPAVKDAEGGAAMTDKVMGLLPQVGGVIVLLLAAFAMFRMAKGGKRRTADDIDLEMLGLATPGVLEAATAAVGAGAAPTALATARSNEMAAAAASASSVRQDVVDLVQKQPEEIAALLRNWLADRRR